MKIVMGVRGSVMGLVGPVSAYWDWARYLVCPATCVSVWQNVNLSEQICSCGTVWMFTDVAQRRN